MTRAELQILLRLKDDASAALKRVSGQSRTFGRDLKQLARNVAIAGAAVAAMGYGLTRLAEDAAKTQTARRILEDLAKTAGTTADAVLANMERSTRGMLSNAQMIVEANRAIAGIGPWFAQELPRAMEAAIAAWKAGGGSFDYYVNSVIRGIGRLSPLILDNLLVQVGAAEATDRFAQMLFNQTEGLTKSQQQMALYNLFLEKMKPLMDAAAGSAGGLEEDIAAARAELANFKEAIGKLVIPALKGIIPEITNVIEAFQLMPEEMQKQALETAAILTALSMAFKIFGMSAFKHILLPVIAGHLFVQKWGQLMEAITGRYDERAHRSFWDSLELTATRAMEKVGLGAEALGGDIVKAYKNALAEVRAVEAPVGDIFEGYKGAAGYYREANEALREQGVLWQQLMIAQAQALDVKDIGKWVAAKERQIAILKLSLIEMEAQGQKGTEIYRIREQQLEREEFFLNALQLRLQGVAIATDVAAASTQNLGQAIEAMAMSHPLVVSLSASIAGLQAHLAGLEAAHRGVQVAMHHASRAYSRMQEQVSRLSGLLSEAKQRLDELTRPRLVGMTALEKETEHIQDYINQIKLARLMGEPISRIEGLPANLKYLERQLEILRLRRQVEFDPLLRELERTARPPAEEITFEDALRQIEQTKLQIGDLKGQVDVANQALAAKKKHMDALQEASWGLSQSIAAVRDLLAQEKEKRDLVIKGLIIALGWFLKDRDELIKTGQITEAEAARIDKGMLNLFDAFSLTTGKKTKLTVNRIQAIVDKVKKLVRQAEAMQTRVAGWGGGAVAGLQYGTRYWQGGLAMVGERGPELVNLPRGAGVYPQPRLAAPGGGRVLNVNLYGDIYGLDDFRERVREAVEYGKGRGWRP